MNRHIALLIVMLSLSASFSLAQPIIVLELQKDSFEGKPGDTINIPILVKNIGDTTAENVTVYISGPVKGFLYTQAVIPKLEPNQTREVNLQIYIKDADAGVYDLKVVSRLGPLLFEKPIKVKVLTIVDYKISMEMNEKYLYGSDVEIKLQVKSLSNGVILGKIELELYSEKGLLTKKSWVTYLNPQDKWEYLLFLPRPGIGKYTAILRTNFGGIPKTLSKSFLVYQRHLSYETKFENGIISVRVFDKEGKGVKDIPVEIEGVVFKTDSFGMVQYEVKEPGVYKIKLNLDGKVVESLVNVEKLFLHYQQQNETLVVYVRDSAGNGIPNVTIKASGSKGNVYAIADSEGKVRINLNETGFGLITLRAESSKYIGDERIITVKKPKPIQTTTTTTKTPTNTTTTTRKITTTTPTRFSIKIPLKIRIDYERLSIILIVSALLFGISSYAAFFIPIKLEEQLDGYYFVKVKAPRLRKLKKFRYRKAISVASVRATKGRVEIKDSEIIWEIDELAPGEEAFLQVIL